VDELRAALWSSRNTSFSPNGIRKLFALSCSTYRKSVSTDQVQLYKAENSDPTAWNRTLWSSGKDMNLYSGCYQFQSPPGHFSPFLQFLEANAELVLRLGHDCYLRNFFQLIISNLVIRCYIVAMHTALYKKGRLKRSNCYPNFKTYGGLVWI
jgi:hypothetical protein